MLSKTVSNYSESVPFVKTNIHYDYFIIILYVIYTYIDTNSAIKLES